MKKLIKGITRYELKGIESVIYIGNIPIKFKRKNVILHALDSLKMKSIHLEKENEKNRRLLEEKENYSKMQEEKVQIQEKKIEHLQRITLLQEKELNNNKIELEQYHTERLRYEEALWCTGWIEHWKKYFIENYRNIEEKTKAIKVGIDEESIKIIDLFLERNFYMMPIQKYADYFLYDRNKIFYDWELYGMAEGMDEINIRQKYRLDSEIYLETPVFKFHCGVLLLPPEVQNHIKDKDIIDGGAFWGDSALVLQEYSPKSIHAFEPMPTNFKQLCELKTRNGLDILHPVPAGLGDRCNEKPIYYHEMLSGASIVNYKAIMNERPETYSDNIDIVTIDSYTSSHDLNVGLIKLDIEGSELEAIKGAIETICKYKPILLISVYHLPKDFFEIKPLLESLNLGYQFMFRKLVYHDPMTEVSLIAYVP